MDDRFCASFRAGVLSLARIHSSAAEGCARAAAGGLDRGWFSSEDPHIVSVSILSHYDRHIGRPEIGAARLYLFAPVDGRRTAETILALSAALCAAAHLCIAESRHHARRRWRDRWGIYRRGQRPRIRPDRCDRDDGHHVALRGAGLDFSAVIAVVCDGRSFRTDFRILARRRTSR